MDVAAKALKRCNLWLQPHAKNENSIASLEKSWFRITRDTPSACVIAWLKSFTDEQSRGYGKEAQGKASTGSLMFRNNLKSKVKQLRYIREDNVNTYNVKDIGYVHTTVSTLVENYLFRNILSYRVFIELSVLRTSENTPLMCDITWVLWRWFHNTWIHIYWW